MASLTLKMIPGCVSVVNFEHVVSGWEVINMSWSQNIERFSEVVNF